MKPARILYIDRHCVIVTKNTLKIRNQSYTLKAVKEHKLSVLPAERKSGMLLLVMGMILITSHFLNFISPMVLLDFGIEGSYISASKMALYSGLMLMIIGAIKISRVRKRYALRIATPEGEQNAIVSHKKEYIGHIINALNNAFRANEYTNN
jgi:hypothetical protein